MRYYSRDLRSDLWGQHWIGVRRIASLIRWLPPEAALWRANKTAWTVDNELNAGIIEMLDALLRAYIQTHSKPTSKKPNPVKIPRPWDKAETSRNRSTTLGDLLSQGLTVRKTPKGGEQ